MQRSIKNESKQNNVQRNVRTRVIAWIAALLLTLPLFSLAISAAELPQTLCPGGIPFGIRFRTEGVMVVGFCDVTENGVTSSPAKDAGILENDRIVKIGGVAVGSAEDFTARISAAEGKSVVLEIARGSKILTVNVTPKRSDADGKYKSGMWIRDGGAGIGTVTFVCPDNYLFAGLGHGICSGERSDLIPMEKGTIFSVKVNDVLRGKQGAPGEIKGQFTQEKLGTLLGNTDLGMFGALTGMPEAMKNDPRCQPIPIAKKSEVEEGPAVIYSTLDGNGISEYAVELCDIHRDAERGKCFSVKVTDPRLIEKSGGIVQGMSGSPIIQNGKLVGAVTHVLINDPTSGYGIFIENMLEEMETSES